ncbi:uncharacterized protein LOC132544244 [Ylistrum balloti]|uniref:uncharacterized protein LOC132544244 n=1 Tax=Ylistrum balloti TaxID=509963 RepID=UPI002905CD7C|nr:uncharacterized protein LOC132544244 [Ylistrum balloti]
MAGLKAAPILVKVFFLCLTAGFWFHLIGFATSYWSHSKFVTVGLWKACYRGYECTKTTYTTSYFEATQAFESLALVAGFIGLLLLIFYIFINQSPYNISLYIASLVGVAFAACCAILGVIIYGCKTSLPLSWSYALAVVGGILYGISAILMAVHLLQKC